MLIIGAGGLAKEVLEIFHQKDKLGNLYFYDDVTNDLPEKLYGQFEIISNMDDAIELFKNDNRFTVGIGNPRLRKMMCEKFMNAGGRLVSAISPSAHIGSYETSIAEGCIIMTGTVVTNNVSIGKNCLINPNCVISHDSAIKNNVEISPGVKITGHCYIDEDCSVGTGAILLPKVRLGKNVTVGAGAVVTRNVEDGLTVVGIPAKPINKKADE
jgi:sugar O-acyltransferase (sialic acid O-acetyltransferase NeuD family)